MENLKKEYTTAVKGTDQKVIKETDEKDLDASLEDEVSRHCCVIPV